MKRKLLIKIVTAIAALSALTIPSVASADVQLNKTKRLILAVQGKSDYVDADFVKPLTDESKQALSQFSECKRRFIGEVTPGEVVIQRIPGRRPAKQVVVGLVCEGHPASAGAGFTVHFSGGKIASVETHAPRFRRNSHG